MRNIFKSKYRVTQVFGPDHFLTINKKQIKASEYYAKFKLKGHEGIDLFPIGTIFDVLCLEDGVVVRDIDDATLGKNYGKFVTIWHPNVKKATQYCHLSNNSVKMGDRLIKGDVIGIMGATGNTQGVHLHLNLFDVDEKGVRLNRENGYFGGIDPLPFLEEAVVGQPTDSQNMQKVINELRSERDRNHNDRMALYQELGFDGEFNRLVAVEKIKMLKSIEKQSGEATREIEKLKEELKKAREELETAHKELKDIRENTQAVAVVADHTETKVNETEERVNTIEKKIDDSLNATVEIRGLRKMIEGFLELLPWRK